MLSYNPEEIFNYMYKELTPDLKEQLEFAKKEWATEAKAKPVEKKKTEKPEEKGAGVVGELEVAE